MPAGSLNVPIRHVAQLAEGEQIALDALQVQALRHREIKEKEAFTIVDREGQFFRASLKQMSKSGGEALVYERMASSTESPADITLLCAVLGRQRMLVVVQKATELGVMRIVPVLSERSVPREGLAHEKAHAWPKQALRAARQCRRANLPEVREAIELSSVLEDACFTDADLRVYLDDRASSRRALEVAAAGAERTRRNIVFAVGPEGGWSDDERSMLEKHGALPLRLGGRVLRAETAVFAGLTLLQHTYGDM
ncbi:MAG: RsmE family RNA methyltransferase [Polyangiales bacterium]